MPCGLRGGLRFDRPQSLSLTLGRRLDSVLHLLEGAHLDLAHTLAADAELGRQLFQRHRLLGEATRLEDAPLTVVEDVKSAGEHAAAVFELVLLNRRLSDEPSTLEDLSRKFGVSRERVRQIEVRAFEKLQKSMRAAAEERNLLDA